MHMYKNLSVLILCAIMIWYAAVQLQETKSVETMYPIQIDPERPNTEVKGSAELSGRICMTAALRQLQKSQDVIVRFVLEGNGQVLRSSVLLTPNSRNENGLYTASAVYENLLSGTYTLYVESASGAKLDYILAEDGSRSKYEIQDNKIFFELSEKAKTGSAWFMMQEGEGDAL